MSAGANPYSFSEFSKSLPAYKAGVLPQSYEKLAERVSYAKEEARLLKAHISSELTRYVNNLTIPGNPIPFMYDQSQAIIAIATIIFYYCAAPFICQIVLDDLETGATIKQKRNAIMSSAVAASAAAAPAAAAAVAAAPDPNAVGVLQFEHLLADKFFRNYWQKGSFKSHSMNTFKSAAPAAAAAAAAAAEHAYILPVKEYDRVAENENKTFEEVFKTRGGTFPSDDATLAKFVLRLQEIVRLCTTKTFAQIIEIPNNFYTIMEDLRTIFIFYFKGGNSIRAIADRFNDLANTPEFKISNINATIPYGSDFDTNILINPFLPFATIKKIEKVFEVFIPQLAAFIEIPSGFEESLKRPTTNIFVSSKAEQSEQQMQMKIVTEAYDKLNRHYLYPKQRARTAANVDTLRPLPPFTLGNDYIEDVTPPLVAKSILWECDNVFKKSICDTSLKINYYYRFPCNNGPANQFTPFSVPSEEMNFDRCGGSLQYYVNGTIEKFRLHRFYLKFKLGGLLQTANLNHRLISTDETFNAEMLDISIVQPVYTLNKAGTAYTCELFDLWNNADDIFKISVPDKYGLVTRLRTIPKIGEFRLSQIPLFINGLNIQIEDLVEAIHDNLTEKKLDKIEKRVKRLRLLQYVKCFSSSYTFDIFLDFVAFSKLSILPIPLDPAWCTKIGVNAIGLSEDQKAIVRSLRDIYLSTTESYIYKTMKPMYETIQYTINGFPMTEPDIFIYVIKVIKTYKGITRELITEYNNVILAFFQTGIKIQYTTPPDSKLFYIQLGDAPEASSVKISDGNLLLINADKSIIVTVKPDSLSSFIGNTMNNPENDYRLNYLFLRLCINSLASLATNNSQGYIYIILNLQEDTFRLLEKTGEIDLRGAAEARAAATAAAIAAAAAPAPAAAPAAAAPAPAAPAAAHVIPYYALALPGDLTELQIIEMYRTRIKFLMCAFITLLNKQFIEYVGTNLGRALSFDDFHDKFIAVYKYAVLNPMPNMPGLELINYLRNIPITVSLHKPGDSAAGIWGWYAALMVAVINVDIASGKLRAEEPAIVTSLIGFMFSKDKLKPLLINEGNFLTQCHPQITILEAITSDGFPSREILYNGNFTGYSAPPIVVLACAESIQYKHRFSVLQRDSSNYFLNYYVNTAVEPSGFIDAASYRAKQIKYIYDPATRTVTSSEIMLDPQPAFKIVPINVPTLGLFGGARTRTKTRKRSAVKRRTIRHKLINKHTRKRCATRRR